MTPGIRDIQTVTADGKSVAPTIEGVKVRSTPMHVDHRGSVYEIFEGEGDYWDSPVVYAYQFSVRPGLVKGWGLHEHKIDRYTSITGDVLTVLYDARPNSPSHGVVQQVMLGDRGVRSVTIPIGVWHMNINVGTDEAKLINFPTEVYHHDAPDRLLLPWDTDEIPFDVRSVLPPR